VSIVKEEGEDKTTYTLVNFAGQGNGEWVVIKLKTQALWGTYFLG
jgi:hypothetical protein